MLIGIRLRPDVAFLLSGLPMSTMVGRRVGLNGVAPFCDLVSEELRPNRPERCIEVLQGFLVKRLEHASLHTVVATALGAIEREHGAARFAGATPGRLASVDVADFSKTRCEDLP